MPNLAHMTFIYLILPHSLPRAKACQPTAGLKSFLSADRSLGVMCGQHIEFPTIVEFLDQDYSYKSAAIQIPPCTDPKITPPSLLWGLN
jgi:hypothetical protein